MSEILSSPMTSNYPADSFASRHSSATIISMHDIRRVYDTGEVRIEALSNISLEIPRGQFIAIMGASGSGKSTLLNLLGCLDHPTSGTYKLDGVDVSTFSPAQRADIRNQKIGFIFQSFNLLPRTSVWENVEAPMLYSGVPKHERTLRIQHALGVVGISEKAKVKPKSTLWWTTAESSYCQSSRQSSRDPLG